MRGSGESLLHTASLSEEIRSLWLCDTFQRVRSRRSARERSCRHPAAGLRVNHPRVAVAAIQARTGRKQSSKPSFLTPTRMHNRPPWPGAGPRGTGGPREPRRCPAAALVPAGKMCFCLHNDPSSGQSGEFRPFTFHSQTPDRVADGTRSVFLQVLAPLHWFGAFDFTVILQKSLCTNCLYQLVLTM